MRKGETMTAEQRAKISASLTGHTVSLETRAKLSDALRKYPPRPKRDPHAPRGPLKAATRAKIGTAHRGRVTSPETRARISAALRGRINGPPSAETIAKIRAANTGKTHSAETRDRISDGHRGHKWGHHSPETKAKLRATKLGRPRSPETVEKMRLAMTGHVVTEATKAKLRGNTNLKNAPVIGECVYCGQPAQHRDHVIPRGRPGSDAPDNLVPACHSCNSSKGQRTPEEWFVNMTSPRRRHRASVRTTPRDEAPQGAQNTSQIGDPQPQLNSAQ